jgi:hypothetical protein
MSSNVDIDWLSQCILQYLELPLWEIIIVGSTSSLSSRTNVSYQQNGSGQLNIVSGYKITETCDITVVSFTEICQFASN